MDEQRPTAAGKSSFDLLDTQRFWTFLSLESGMNVLDLGCGAGAYTLPLALRVGPSGSVKAVDAWDEGIRRLKAEAGRQGIANIETHVADAAGGLPLVDKSVDLCLMATVLHDFAADGTAKQVLTHLGRVLKPGGVIAVVEFKKQDGPPGPPKAVRMAIEDVAFFMQPFGWTRFSAVTDLGPHLYGARFRCLSRTGQWQGH